MMSGIARGLAALVVLATVFVPAGRADGALLFDNYDAAGNRPASTGAGESYLAKITVATAITITDIAVLNDLSAAGDIKFVIFDAVTHNLLYSSSAEAFAMDTTSTYKVSDDFSFTLAAGGSYYIGGIADVAALWNFDQTFNSMNGITSGRNGIDTNFASPTFIGSGGADINVRLYGYGAPVPEPASAALLGTAGLAGLGIARARRRRRDG